MNAYIFLSHGTTAWPAAWWALRRGCFLAGADAGAQCGWNEMSRAPLGWWWWCMDGAWDGSDMWETWDGAGAGAGAEVGSVGAAV
jgi:hypothetical protein